MSIRRMISICSRFFTTFNTRQKNPTLDLDQKIHVLEFYFILDSGPYIERVKFSIHCKTMSFLMGGIFDNITEIPIAMLYLTIYN